MPCYDPRDHDGGAWDRRERAKYEALLCGVLYYLSERGLVGEIFDTIDWKEVGMNRHEAERWWTTHKEADARRRRRADLRKAASAKLTPEERTVLGLNED